jgi:hypothetical protein
VAVSQHTKTWGWAARQALDNLAQILWPPDYVLGVIPRPAYRLRYQQINASAHLWWIERDIPPYDQYQCAAYRVCLTFEAQGEPCLTVQSGTTFYPVTPLTEEALEAAVAQAGQDPPLIIPRMMGHAKY